MPYFGLFAWGSNKNSCLANKKEDNIYVASKSVQFEINQNSNSNIIGIES